MIMKDLSEIYTRQDHAFREYDRYARAKYHLTLRWLRPHMQSGMRLFNIGVGSGYFNHLAVKAKLNVVGCEPDPHAFAAAFMTKPKINCEIVQASLSDFVTGDRGPADFIVMHDVLEHIQDDNDAAKNLQRLTHPGTRIIISVPASPSLFGQHDIELGHFRRYTKKTLRAVLEPYFHIHRLRYYGMMSMPIVLYFSVIKRSTYPRVGASKNLVSQVYGAICEIESYVPEPFGTSIVAELRPRVPTV